MSRTRSRPKTEQKFQNAVLKLVADEGCGALGINAVAQLAGADKVLIYRYFGDFNGLLELVAQSRQWLPTSDEVISALIGSGSNHDPLSLLRKIADTVIHHIQSDASTHQLVRWRRTKACPLCLHFTKEWLQLWHSLPLLLTQGLNSEQRKQWAQACSLLALLLEAELCSEAPDRHCLERIAADLETIPSLEEAPSSAIYEDSLPTNLL